MKRIYMALALVSGLAFGAKAQTIDLEAIIALPTAGQVINAHQVLDTSKILCGIAYNGTASILAGDAVMFMSSFSAPSSTPGSFFIDGVVYQNDLTIADTGVIFVFPNTNEIGQGHTAPFRLSSDSIRVVFNWDQWNLNDSIVVVQPPFVNGQSYGFFFRAIDVRDEAGATINTDPNPANNFAVQRIVWNSGTSVQEFANKEKTNISLYPNPATSVINFEFNSLSPSHSTVLVRDITGKVVYSKNYGRTNSGVQKYSIDITKLSAGTYTLEFDTDTQNATSKFTVK